MHWCPSPDPILEVRFASCHVSCLSFNSAILIRLQVCWDLPLLRFPFGFQSMALLAMYLSGLLSMPVVYPTPSSSQSSLLRIHLGQQIRRVFLRLLLRIACNFCFKPLVSRQPYRNIGVLLKSATPKYNFFKSWPKALPKRRNFKSWVYLRVCRPAVVRACVNLHLLRLRSNLHASRRKAFQRLAPHPKSTQVE